MRLEKAVRDAWFMANPEFFGGAYESLSKKETISQALIYTIGNLSSLGTALVKHKSKD